MTKTDRECDALASVAMNLAIYDAIYSSLGLKFRRMYIRFARDAANAIIRIRADEMQCAEHDKIQSLNNVE
jgi:hypothetical protein